GRNRQAEDERRRHDDHDKRGHERRLQRERARCRVTDIAVAAEAEALVEGLRRRVLLCLEACEDRPGDRKDPEEADEPGERPETGYYATAFADAELSAASPFAVGHARSSSLNRLDRTRNANVAMMIAKVTTTIA